MPPHARMGQWFSFRPEGGSGVAPGPGDEGAKKVFTVGQGVFELAPLEVFVDRHEGREPESGGGHPLDEGMGVRRRFTVGLAHRRFDAELFGQPAETYDGKFLGQDSL